MRILTSSEMSAIDLRAQQEFFIPGNVLMESAGKAAWDAFSEACLSDRPMRFVFVAGAGNNGGDAMVMARYCTLGRRHSATVLLARSGMGREAEAQHQIIHAMGIPSQLWTADPAAGRELLGNADWIVDGLAGTGLTGALRDPYTEIVSAINESQAQVAAVDTPSGVGDGVAAGGVAVQADITLALGLPKHCLYTPANRRGCGRIVVVPFTLPPQLVAMDGRSDELLGADDLAGLLPAIRSDAHKGQRGILAVFAGAVGTTGAAALASESALSAGAGLVTLITDDETVAPLASQLRSVMVRPASRFVARDAHSFARFHAAVIGPGWGTGTRRENLMRELVPTFAAGVIDADGLTVLAGMNERPPLANWVLTPHPGELALLLGAQRDEILGNFASASRTAADTLGSVVVAKAVTTVIAHPDGRVGVIDGMCPAIATAGSGDVLAGVIGGLLARGLDPWDAARGGVLAHQIAGRRLSASAGLFRSSEYPAEIARVIGEIVLDRGSHGA